MILDAIPAEAIPETFGSKLPPVNDRMLTTLFIAGLLHAIIILGISFSAPPATDSSDPAPALEVVLVGEHTPKLEKNPKAHYLAQRNQKGAGNARHHERTRIPTSSLLAMRREGVPDSQGAKAQAASGLAGEDQLIASRRPTVMIKYFAAPSQRQVRAEVPRLLENKPDLGLAANEDDAVLRISGNTGRELWVTADTRESTVAVYLDAWRRKVERIGTINFPTLARNELLSGTPVIEVAIASDGKLARATIRHSSGAPEVDQAALAILKLASPFDPFPQALSREHDELRFAYEWQFLGGQSASSSVLLADPETARGAGSNTDAH